MNPQHTSGAMRSCGLMLATALFSGSLWADDLTGSDVLLCYGWSAAVCHIEGECDNSTPWDLNMPDFLKLDLEAGIAETTATSPVERETELRTVEREDGIIVLQGRQGDGAFSWLISEATGEGTLTVSTPGDGIVIFTLCTPTEGL